MQLHQRPRQPRRAARAGSSPAPTRRRARRAGTAAPRGRPARRGTSGAASRARSTIAAATSSATTGRGRCGRCSPAPHPRSATAAPGGTSGARGRATRSRNRAGAVVAPLGRPRLVHLDGAPVHGQYRRRDDVRGDLRSSTTSRRRSRRCVAGARPRSIALSGGGTAGSATSCSRRGRRLERVDGAASATNAGCRSTTPTPTRAWREHVLLDQVAQAIHASRPSATRSTGSARDRDDARARLRPGRLVHLGLGPDAHRLAVPGRPTLASASASWSDRRRAATRTVASRSPTRPRRAGWWSSPSPATTSATRSTGPRRDELTPPPPRVVVRRRRRLGCAHRRLVAPWSGPLRRRRRRDAPRRAARRADGGGGPPARRRPRHSHHLLAQGVHPARRCCAATAAATARSPSRRPASTRRTSPLDEVLAIARRGAALGCHEALFTLGEAPEDRYPVAGRLARRARLRVDGRLPRRRRARRCSRRPACSPTPTPARSSQAELERLRAVSPVAGDDDRDAGGPARRARAARTHGAPDKTPERRLATLEAAGRAAVPFTTGILVGIGETRAERLDALRRDPRRARRATVTCRR